MTNEQKTTIATIDLVSPYNSPYNLYQMRVAYDYNPFKVIRNFTEKQATYKQYGVDQAAVRAVCEELNIPFQDSISFKPFGCTACNLIGDDGEVRMGRNYDFHADTSGMMVYNAPKSGYRSIAFAPLDNLNVTDPITDGEKTQERILFAPFACVDGINENGVSVAVLVAGNKPYNPTRQYSYAANIFTTLLVRLVLDWSVSTRDAIDLLTRYNMFATGEYDYHFYINDAEGNGVVLEYDCDSAIRECVVIDKNVVTNFYIKYLHHVDDENKYGHGKKRYDAVLDVFDKEKGNYTNETVWRALKATAQDAVESDTSNTQWSVVYNNTQRTADIVFRKNWSDTFTFTL